MLNKKLWYRHLIGGCWFKTGTGNWYILITQGDNDNLAFANEYAVEYEEHPRV